MEEGKSQDLREKTRSWTCNHFSITNHDGDTAALLRKVADNIEQLGAVDIMDITYSKQLGLTTNEVTLTVYFTISE